MIISESNPKKRQLGLSAEVKWGATLMLSQESILCSDEQDLVALIPSELLSIIKLALDEGFITREELGGL